MAQQLARLPAPPKSAEFQFERPDWTLFRSVETLSQKAGVPTKLLRRLALKELVDNALDAGGTVSAGRLDASGNRYFVEDSGPGIPPADVARLFSINRPLVSSKLWRMPLRGALGNGLRVVVGAVAASDGALEIWTGNSHLVLHPQEDGTTRVSAQQADFPIGCRVEVTFGAALPTDEKAIAWAEAAIRMAASNSSYTGKPSPWWYDGDHFFDLLRAAGDRTVREIIAKLDGCTGAKAGRIAEPYKTASCSSLNRQQATALLQTARTHSRPVSATRLGAVGQIQSLPPAYAIEHGSADLGTREPRAIIPCVAEAWAYFSGDPKSTKVHLDCFVNRTPITGQLTAYIYKKTLVLRGCGLNHEIDVASGDLDVVLNLTTPYCPITTDGKEPNLEPFVETIADAISKAVKKAKRIAPKLRSETSETTQKAIILANLAQAIAKARRRLRRAVADGLRSSILDWSHGRQSRWAWQLSL